MGEKKNPRDRTAEEESSTLGRVDVHTYMDDNRKNIANARDLLFFHKVEEWRRQDTRSTVHTRSIIIHPSIQWINHQPIQLIHPSIHRPSTIQQILNCSPICPSIHPLIHISSITSSSIIHTSLRQQGPSPASACLLANLKFLSVSLQRDRGHLQLLPQQSSDLLREQLRHLGAGRTTRAGLRRHVLRKTCSVRVNEHFKNSRICVAMKCRLGTSGK